MAPTTAPVWVVVQHRDGKLHRMSWEAVAAGILEWERIPELCDLVAGRHRRRATDAEITVFKNNVGMGLQFAAVAPRIYELARAAGIGRELPAEWFLEDMKP